MLRIFILAVIIVLAVVTFKPGFFDNAPESPPVQALRDFGSGTAPAFRSRLEAGADCAELISIRDTYDSSSGEVARMDLELRSIGCYSVTSERTN